MAHINFNFQWFRFKGAGSLEKMITSFDFWKPLNFMNDPLKVHVSLRVQIVA